MKNIPDVSIVVSSWNASDIIKEALESIASTTGEVTFEVTVIDDASTDGGIAHVIDQFENDPRFSFVQNEKNIGISALNIMLKRTQSKYILLFDTDARMNSDALQNLFSFMEAHPEAGAATANLLNPDGSVQFYYRRILTPALYFFTTPLGRFIDKYFLGLHYYKWFRYDGLDITRNPELEQPPLACLMVRREALSPHPYILDSFSPIYLLDVDLCKRIYDHGYKIYLVSAAKAVHLKTASASKRGKAWLDRELNRSFALYFKKHYPRSYPVMRAVIFMDTFIRACMLRTIGREPAR